MRQFTPIIKGDVTNHKQIQTIQEIVIKKL